MLRAVVSLYKLDEGIQEGSKNISSSNYEKNYRGRQIVTYLQAYNILDMNVAGAVVRGVSIIYATTVGRDDATASVMIAPEADHVKISICPGVSKIT